MEHAIAVAFGSTRTRSSRPWATRFPPGHSAEVAPFPSRATRQSSDPTLRMKRAVEKLEIAIQTQKAAVADWRRAIGKASEAFKSLDHSMSLYRHRLAVIDLQPLKQSSLQLAAIMDQTLAVRG